MADTRTPLGEETSVSTGVLTMLGVITGNLVRRFDLAALKLFVSITGEFVGTTGAQTVESKTIKNCIRSGNFTRHTTDTDVTVTHGTNTEIYHLEFATAAARVVTLAGGVEGAYFKFTRKAAGAGTWSIGGLKTLSSLNDWCEVRYSNGAWVLEAS